MSLTTKVKAANFSFLNEKSYNKTLLTSILVDIIQLLTSISVDIRIYLHEKEIIHRGS